MFYQKAGLIKNGDDSGRSPALATLTRENGLAAANIAETCVVGVNESAFVPIAEVVRTNILVRNKPMLRQLGAAFQTKPRLDPI